MTGREEHGTRVEWIARRERFAAIASAWDELARRQLGPFLLSAWLLAWWDGFASSYGVRVVVLWREDTVAAGAPIAADWRRWTTTANGTTPLTSFLAVDESARTRLVDEILAHSPGQLELRGLLTSDPCLHELVDAGRRAGRWIVEGPLEASPTVDTTGSFTEYHARLSRKVRRETGRLRRKAEAEHRLELAPLAVPDDVGTELEAALALEARGWKGRDGTAAVSRPDTARFFRTLARNFHAIGGLRISTLTLDGELAAMGIGIVHSRRLFTLRVAYEERHRHLGPGFMLLVATIERCCDTELAAYEFCGSSEEYERRFATGEHIHRHVRMYGPSFAGAARYAYRREIRDRLRDGAAALSARRAALGLGRRARGARAGQRSSG